METSDNNPKKLIRCFSDSIISQYASDKEFRFIHKTMCLSNEDFSKNRPKLLRTYSSIIKRAKKGEKKKNKLPKRITIEKFKNSAMSLFKSSEKIEINTELKPLIIEDDF